MTDLPPFGKRPLALVLTGAAAFGAWQGGAMRRLDRDGIGFEAVFGASAGALNGVAYFQGKAAKMRELWTNIHRSDIMQLRPHLNPPSIYSSERFLKFLQGYVDEEKAKRESRCHFFVITTDLANGGLFQAHFSPGGRDGWDGPLKEILLASCSIPAVFPPVHLRTNDGKERILVDGGLQAATDIRPALALGCRDFLIPNFIYKRFRKPPRSGLVDYLAFLGEHLVLMHIENTLEALRFRAETAGDDPIRAYVLTPKSPVSLHAMKFDSKECATAFDQGESDAETFLADPEKYRVI